ncbi:hypothetical protein [Rossellomorea sp. YZS02]|uniref:hypothetical protein n=1 Tax=Rossellomorea sp. YZS02 TaxID=3097358 RepID=UPI002A12C6A9|nr:hypothetical protein [Rossellomorea sp. YZS02]MDX8342144.1 hypothetical protein [Rossellomorea sp. YZS02]
MVQVWKERANRRNKHRAIEKAVIITILTGAALFAVSSQMKKGRGRDESICTS